jgi:dTDP-4-dehydrorhamnose 3,5-epimerase-like enzyme
MTSAIDGVLMRALTTHGDPRGSVAELYQADWGAGIEPLQWHVLVSRAGSLRGMHLHVRHLDYKVVVAGQQERRAGPGDAEGGVVPRELELVGGVV